MSDYAPTAWVNGGTAVTAEVMNQLEAGVDTAHDELHTHEANVAAHPQLTDLLVTNQLRVDVRQGMEAILEQDDTQSGLRLRLNGNPANGAPLFLVSSVAGTDRFVVQQGGQLVEVTPNGLLVAGSRAQTEATLANTPNTVEGILEYDDPGAAFIGTGFTTIIGVAPSMPAAWSSYDLHVDACVYVSHASTNGTTAYVDGRVTIQGVGQQQHRAGLITDGFAFRRTPMMVSGTRLGLTATLPAVNVEAAAPAVNVIAPHTGWLRWRAYRRS